MPTVASILPRSLLSSKPISSSSTNLALSSTAKYSANICNQFLRFGLLNKGKFCSLVVASSAASFDEVDATGKSVPRSSKKSVLSNLIQEIEPLDLNLIQKDVPVDTVDAMKRTVSGMLGLLPSDQFNVSVEAFWGPLSKLLISSMMTGYTLRNAEYRLCLENSMGACEDDSDDCNLDAVERVIHEKSVDAISEVPESSVTDNLLPETEKSENTNVFKNIDAEKLGEISPEAEKYFLYLKSCLSSAQRELDDLRRKNAALQVQQFVGEEKNDLLDYLRSLEPEKVAELSEPTCPSVKESIHSVVHGLLATLSPKMHSRYPPQSENPQGGNVNIGKDDCAELIENSSLQFQPMISLPRDYLARLLFWCMLLGHYIRGIEYRLELMHALTISGDTENCSS